MPDKVYLDEVLELGVTLKKLGPDWAKYLPRVRDLYRDLRAGRAVSTGVQHVQLLRDVLQLGEHPMRVSRLCPRCSPQPGEPWSGVRTVYAFPDRHTSQCSRCSTEWLVMDNKGWVASNDWLR